MFRQAVILAGGLGTRLRSVVADRPKPMAEFRGRPFLEYQIRFLREQGIREVVLCIGYLADEILKHFGDGAGRDVNIRYSREPEALGTGGAVKLAEPLLEDVFFLLNGDTLLSCDLTALSKHHLRHHADITIAVSMVQDAMSFGVVGIGAGNIVSHFQEKGTASGSAYVNAGLYVLCKQLIHSIPSNRPVSLEEELLPEWVATRRVIAFVHNSGFIDIGTPEGCKHFDLLVRRHDR